eukprot:1158251-Pelagomonas_calceolata.AAC.3
MAEEVLYCIYAATEFLLKQKCALTWALYTAASGPDNLHVPMRFALLQALKVVAPLNAIWNGPSHHHIRLAWLRFECA